MRGGFLPERTFKVPIDLDEPGAAHGRDQPAELLRPVEDLVVVHVVELILQGRLPDRILERGNVGARVEIEATEEAFPDGLAVSDHIPREAEPGAYRLQIGDGGFRRRDRLEVRRLFRREAVLRPADLVAVEAHTGVDREAPRNVPPVLCVEVG